FVAIMIIVFLLVLLFPGGIDTAVGSPGDTPIQGLTLQKQCNPLNAHVNDIIDCKISWSLIPSTIPLDSITIVDKVPDNSQLDSVSGNATCEPSPCGPATKTVSWQMQDPQNQQTSTFDYKLKATQDNTYIINQASATTTAGGGSGNSCSQSHEGTGYCSVQNLSQYFSSNVVIASMICQAESGSNPQRTNKVCPDYSIGLFQVNEYAWCPAARPHAAPACYFENNSARDACEQQLLDPIQNIQKAVQISGGGVNWGPWSTWPGVQQQARQ